MTPAVQSMVAATYVRDIDTSRAFYELLGFHERSAGKAAASAWSALYYSRGFTLSAAVSAVRD
jgi:catechol 2,3-dioxygenase-like lactoylglutathione lyase family enzyme